MHARRVVACWFLCVLLRRVSRFKRRLEAHRQAERLHHAAALRQSAGRDQDAVRTEAMWRRLTAVKTRRIPPTARYSMSMISCACQSELLCAATDLVRDLERGDRAGHGRRADLQCQRISTAARTHPVGVGDTRELAEMHRLVGADVGRNARRRKLFKRARHQRQPIHVRQRAGRRRRRRNEVWAATR